MPSESVRRRGPTSPEGFPGRAVGEGPPGRWYPGQGGPGDAQYGPDVPGEAELRLLGPLEGKRVLELGCAGGHNSVAFARAGAIAIGVDTSAERLAEALRRREREGVKVELHEGDLADLAFLRAESVDVVFSAHALAYVGDLDRVFRQAHRVLRTGALLVFSLPHPASAMVDVVRMPPMVRRSYFDPTPLPAGDGEEAEHPYTLGELFVRLGRAGLSVDHLVEPEPPADGPRSPHWREAYRLVPHTLVVRARKERS